MSAPTSVAQLFEAKRPFCDGHHILGRTIPVGSSRVRNRTRGSIWERTGASHAQIRFYRCRSLHRGVLRRLDRLDQRARRSSCEYCQHRSDADDGRFSQFARRALRRLFACLSLNKVSGEFYPSPGAITSWISHRRLARGCWWQAPARIGTCVYQKSDPAILVMKGAKDRS